MRTAAVTLARCWAAATIGRHVAVALSCVLLTATTALAGPEFFVFDNGVGRGSWTPTRQATTLKELGYDGISYNHTTPEDLVAWQGAASAPHNVLTASEKAAGWRLLFDGRTTDGWKGFGKPAFPADGWVVEDGTLKGLGRKGGDIITTATFDDFEFAWEWRLSFKGNSGIKYFVDERRGNAGGAIGHEYQTIDDDHYTAMALSERQKTGAWYDVLPPAKRAARPVGEWNRSRLIVQGNIVEHWLNDVLVLRYDITSAEAAAGIATSKFKDVEGYADKIRTPILLQDHDTVVWFRNLKVRELTTGSR